MQTRSRLPFPYRPEAEVVAALLREAASLPDWSRVVQTATPWVDAVRRDPPPFCRFGRESIKPLYFIQISR